MQNSELFSRSMSDKPVIGIAEWGVYYQNYDVVPPEEGAIEQTIEAHETVGINHLAWAIGRAVVEYHSSNPRNTLVGELGPEDGDRGSSISATRLRLVRKECQFRRAIKVCRERGMKFWGRLCMNRYYNNPESRSGNSRFGEENPQFWERTRTGGQDRGRLCYAFDEVQEERLDILTEVQQLGVDGLVLDFCRQPPITRYHPRWVELYVKSGGRDPRSWKDPTFEQLIPWFQFRANVVTEFMRELRKRIHAGEGPAEGRVL